MLWIDGTANVTRSSPDDDLLHNFTTTNEGVAEIVRHCKEAKINTLVIDVKPLSGEVLYHSKYAPRLKTWKGHDVPDFDVLEAFVREGHKAGLQIVASMNVLSEGHKLFGTGLAYSNPEWQSGVYVVERSLVADGFKLPIHYRSEPDDRFKPRLYTGNETLLAGSQNSGMVGLESVEQNSGVVAGKPVGKQINILLDDEHRVSGIIDSGLLGDDSLVTSENGYLVTATRPEDIDWVTNHLHAGMMTRFEMKSEIKPIAQAPSEKIACFVCPLNPVVRKRVMDIVTEIIQNYKVDGIVLDRCRFASLNNDFSQRMKDAFYVWLLGEQRVKSTSSIRWPADIFAFPRTPGDELVIGSQYENWLEFRAKTIHDLVAEISRTAHRVRQDITIGTYVGSWYPAYYEVGVNWGSPKTKLRYSWFTPTYPQTGYAEYFDWISPGCYYPIATAIESRRQGLSPQFNVEFAASLARNAIAEGTFVYPGVMVSDYQENPQEMLRALKACGEQGEGWMLFDLSYIEEYGWWPILNQVSKKDAKPPHTMPGLLSQIRSARASAQK